MENREYLSRSLCMRLWPSLNKFILFVNYTYDDMYTTFLCVIVIFIYYTYIIQSDRIKHDLIKK